LQEGAAGDHDEFAAETEEKMSAFVDRDEHAVHQEQQACAADALVEEERVENEPGNQGDARDRLPGLFEFFEDWQALGP
jgi:hypothetical protein